jgi:RNA polymerase sigma factor (TIGR02999 family)
VTPNDTYARELFFTAIYPKLRALAHARLRIGRDTMIGTTVLVHECYVRMAESAQIRPEHWPDFLNHASRTMRNIIVDAIRRRMAERHGGRADKVELIEEAACGAQRDAEEILAVHRALEQLEMVDARLARVVEMRYFAGMTEPEIAQGLGVTERTVRRDWQKARLLLAGELGGRHGDARSSAGALDSFEPAA